MIPAGRPPMVPDEPNVCHCMCAMIHPDRNLCRADAPAAMVSFDTTGMKNKPAGDRREVVMCAPCAKATVRVHPRAVDIVILEVRAKAES